MTDPLDPPPRAVGEPAEEPVPDDSVSAEAAAPDSEERAAAADAEAAEPVQDHATGDAAAAEDATPDTEAADLTEAPEPADAEPAGDAPELGAVSAGAPESEGRTVDVDAAAERAEAPESADAGAAPELGVVGAPDSEERLADVEAAAERAEAPESAEPAGDAPEPGADPAGARESEDQLADVDAAAEGAEVSERAPESADEQTAEVDATPPDRRDIRTLLRERRTLVIAAAAVVVVAVVATLGITGGDDRPVIPSGSMPTLGNQFAVPSTGGTTTAPGEAETLPAFAGNPLWTVRLPTDDSQPGFAVSDSGYVLQDQKEVVGLDKAGKEVWRFTPPEVDYTTVRVTGSQVFVGYNNPDDDRWPQPQVIVSLNAATGVELWRETEASLWSVTTDTIYMSVCYGGQNDRVGDCMFSARNLADNSTRWKVPTYASSRMENDSRDMQAEPTPPYLLVGAYRTGADTYSLSSHDPATGALLGRGFTGPNERVGSIDTVAARTLVTTDDDDDNPADGCTATLTGFSMSGDAKWQYTARTVKEEDGKRCGRQPRSRNNGRMGVTAPNGAPSILNVETGAIEWSAPPKGQAIAASDTMLLVAEVTADGTSEIVAYRVGDAKPVWRAPLPVESHGSTVTITGTQVVATGYNDAAIGYDLATGKGWTYGSWVAQETSTWFAVCEETVCKGFAIR